MASTSGVADAATRSLPSSIPRSVIHCGSMYVKQPQAHLLCCAKCFDTLRNASYAFHMSRQSSERAAVTSFGEHAEESLLFIRKTMERSSTFTAVPRPGGVGMGIIGIAAAVLAANQSSAERWLIVWF